MLRRCRCCMWIVHVCPLGMKPTLQCYLLHAAHPPCCIRMIIPHKRSFVNSIHAYNSSIHAQITTHRSPLRTPARSHEWAASPWCVTMCGSDFFAACAQARMRPITHVAMPVSNTSASCTRYAAWSCVMLCPFNIAVLAAHTLPTSHVQTPYHQQHRSHDGHVSKPFHEVVPLGPTHVPLLCGMCCCCDAVMHCCTRLPPGMTLQC